MPSRSTTSNPITEADALIAEGQPKRALEILQQALAAGRGGLMTRLALGRAHLAAGNIESALSELRAASELGSSVADAALALGQALMAAGHLPAAVAEFERAARLDPDFAAARHALGLAWLEAGEPDRAIEFLSTLAATPFTADAAEKITLARAMKTAHRSPPGYIRHLFDQFSSDYDMRMLDALDYRAHLILRELADLVLVERSGLDILDLGCGTGLAGAEFVQVARHLDGVDLSPRMVERARARGVYRHLMVADLEQALAEAGPSYDLILAADTLVYIGDLGPVFRGACRRLKAGGFLLATFEKKDEPGYGLGQKRRYRHSEDYLREEAARSGLDTMGLLRCIPRTDARCPVNGLAAALQRPRA
jgi:predicted TPR repeat methyltransferase